MASKKKTAKPVKKNKKAVVKKAKTTKKVAAKKSSNKKVVSKKTTKAKVVKTKAAKTKTTKLKKVKAPVVKAKAVKVKVAKPKVVKAKAVKTTSVAPKVDYSKAITPLGDRLVVRAKEGERVTAGGIIIPDSASTVAGYLKAEVLAAGTGSKNKKGLLKPLDVQVGDIVLFNSYAGTKVTFNSEELQIIHESDVMGVVQD